MNVPKSTLLVAALVFCFAPAIAMADPDFSKLGFTANDLTIYRHVSLPACASVRQENKDPMEPSGGVDAYRHYAHLYAQCQAEMEAQHYGVGVLRVNDVFLGVTCVALGATDPGDDVDPACNIKSYLPKP
jgi:hypothetical protein